MGSGVSKGHSGRRPHFGRSPAGLQEIPGGAPPPPAPRSPPEGLPGCGLDHFKAPRSCCRLEASRGLPETSPLGRLALERLWGANARKNPSGGTRGRGRRLVRFYLYPTLDCFSPGLVLPRRLTL